MDRLTGDVPTSALAKKLDLEDPFYQSNRRVQPEEPSRTIQLARVETPMGEGGGGGGGGAAPPAPIDEEQESDHPFAIKVKIAGKGLSSGDWETAIVEVLSGTYDTYVGGPGGPFDANGETFPDAAYSQTINKADYAPYIYLAVPLELTSESSGVRAADGKFYRAIDGGIIVLRKTPTEWVWPNVLDPAGASPPRTAIKIGTWGIARYNTSPGGIASWDLRIEKQNDVSDNITIGLPYEDGERISRTASFNPWTTVQQSATTVDVKQPLLYNNILTGATVTVTGLTGLELGTATTFWLKGTFNSTGTPTAWEVTTTAPTGDRITWGASPTFYQTGAWYPLGRVVSGSHPQMSGFDFISGGEPYHLEQLCSVPLLLVRGAVNGRLVWYPTPL